MCGTSSSRWDIAFSAASTDSGRVRVEAGLCDPNSAKPMARARDPRVQSNSNLPTANSTATCSSTSTMAATPKRSVHWNYEDMSFSELSSPGSAGSESFVSTSSLEYANAQLLAHGYVDKAGLCLDGVSNVDSEAVVRCLLKLLGDRMVRPSF